MEVPDVSPAVFPFRNRTLILAATPPIALLCFTRILANMRSGEPWLNWLAGLVLWLYLFLLALRRRPVLTQEGFEYTDYFTTVHIPWAHITRLASRRPLGLWSIEGLEVSALSGGPDSLFIDLTQFSKSWRQETLGSMLRRTAPHLFEQPAPGGGAA